MRYLFALTLLVFSCMFLLETTKAVQLPSVMAKSSRYTKEQAAKLSGPSMKARVCFGKFLIENITVWPQFVKKASSPQYFFSNRQERHRDNYFVTLKSWHNYSAHCYSYIFDFLYPKHVFW